MKNLLFLFVAFVAAVSCASDDATPVTVNEASSYLGSWKQVAVAVPQAPNIWRDVSMCAEENSFPVALWTFNPDGTFIMENVCTEPAALINQGTYTVQGDAILFDTFEVEHLYAFISIESPTIMYLQFYKTVEGQIVNDNKYRFVKQ